MHARWEGNPSLLPLPARPCADHHSILPEDVEMSWITLSPLRPDAFHLSILLLPFQRRQTRGRRLSTESAGKEKKSLLGVRRELIRRSPAGVPHNGDVTERLFLARTDFILL